MGGRASTKSTFAADYVLASIAKGGIWCCAREFQNSIDDSVHRLLEDEIDRLGLNGFKVAGTEITHQSKGRAFYKGLSRNITSLKSSLSGIKGLWVEEGESLSANTLRVLSASVRASAKDAQAYIDGEEDLSDVQIPEILICLNRGSVNDPIAKKYLERAESELERCGYYEDDVMMIVEANWNDLPKKWWEASGLEIERADDEKNMPRPMYDHKWNGKYLEMVENSIILPEWFDACIDAHEKLGFKAEGQERVSYDPADTGDAKGLAYVHGSVVKDVIQNKEGRIDAATQWAMEYAYNHNVDVFTWDCDGMGMGLLGEVNRFFDKKQITVETFKGSEGPQNPDQLYEESSNIKRVKKNKEFFSNRRAQAYWLLRDRMFKTWRAVTSGEYINPDELISFSSSIEDIKQLKGELCRVPRKNLTAGKIQLATKSEMQKIGIPSPNMADAVMMAVNVVLDIKKGWSQPLPVRRRSIA